MTDKSSVELGAIGSLFPSCFRLLCDFQRAQAWERWVNKGANEVSHSDKESVLRYLKNLHMQLQVHCTTLFYMSIHYNYYYVSQ